MIILNGGRRVLRLSPSIVTHASYVLHVKQAKERRLQRGRRDQTDENKPEETKEGVVCESGT